MKHHNKASVILELLEQQEFSSTVEALETSIRSEALAVILARSYLRDKSPFVRTSAVKTLGFYHRKFDEEAIRCATRDRNWNVRSEAYSSLAWYDSPANSAIFIQAVQTEKDLICGRWAIDGLADWISMFDDQTPLSSTLNVPEKLLFASRYFAQAISLGELDFVDEFLAIGSRILASPKRGLPSKIRAWSFDVEFAWPMLSRSQRNSFRTILLRLVDRDPRFEYLGEVLARLKK